MSRRSNIRKRQRQKRRHALRPKLANKPVARIKTADLFGAILAQPHSGGVLAEAIENLNRQ